jgi:hypothetical protein
LRRKKGIKRKKTVKERNGNGKKKKGRKMAGKTSRGNK